MGSGHERREFTRYEMPSMYTSLVVRPVGVHPTALSLEGHIYDLSEGGIRFEVDQALEPGTDIELAITLPGPSAPGAGSLRAVARVVRLEEDDLDGAGPVRTACEFTSFADDLTHESLVRQLAGGRFSSAA